MSVNPRLDSAANRSRCGLYIPGNAAIRLSMYRRRASYPGSVGRAGAAAAVVATGGGVTTDGASGRYTDFGTVLTPVRTPDVTDLGRVVDTPPVTREERVATNPPPRHGPPHT